MKPIPDLTNTEAMAVRGRRSAIMSLRAEAASEIRDVATHLQSVDVFQENVSVICQRGREVLQRFEDLAKLAQD